MEAARAARYRLLHDVAERNWPAQPVAVLTGHTREDDVETFLMNLARGSGLDGLAGMPARRLLDRMSPHVWLMRPLLAQRRDILRAELAERGIGWIDDPSNDTDTFERVRVRKALDASGAGRDVVEGVSVSMARLRDVSDALADQIATLTTALTALDGAGLVRALRWSALAEQPPFIGKQILAQTLEDCGGQGRGPSLKKLDAFWAVRMGGERTRTPFQATLGGCLIRGVCRRQGKDHLRDDDAFDDDVLEICREPERVAFPIIDIEPGEVVLWDHRFAVSVAPDHGRIVRVAPRDAAFWDCVVEAASVSAMASDAVMACQLAKPALKTLPVAAHVDEAHADATDGPVAAVALPPPFAALSRSPAPVRIEWLGETRAVQRRAGRSTPKVRPLR